MRYELIEVGGRVRDYFLGVESKDVDYTVVVLETNHKTMDSIFGDFVTTIELEGYKVYTTNPSCVTVRAKFPKGHVHEGLDADFVLARKELGYKKGTREPELILGTLEDDLIRRDFTVNTLGRRVDGTIVDLFNGQEDLKYRVLRTPTDAAISFSNDPLRILRAMRFSITKEFMFSEEIINAIELFPPELMKVVSTERIREELLKMFTHDTLRTLELLKWLQNRNAMLYQTLFSSGMRLLPTLKK